VNVVRLEDIIKYLPVAILSLYALMSITSFWTSHERELIDIFDDDAYYYFKIAKNIAESGRLTFDGKSITNGFHPLWLIVLIPFFIIWDDPISVLRPIGTFSVILAALTGLLGLRYLFRYSTLSYTLAAGLLLASIVSFGSTGMEVTILLPLLVIALIRLEQIRPWHTSPGLGRIVALGLILSLVQFARLDAVLLLLVILALVLLANRAPNNLTKPLALGLPPSVTGACYLIYNHLAFGHVMPTSGLAKSMRNDSFLFNSKFLAQMTTPKNPVDGMLWVVFTGVLLVSVGYVSWLLLIKLKNRETSFSESDYVPIIVASFFIVFTAYQLFRTSWVLWRWYAYPVLLASIFLIPYISERIEQHLKGYDTFRIPLQVITAAAVTLLLIRMSMVGIIWGYWKESIRPSFKYVNYLAAQALNKDLPPTVVLGMGDRAGSFAYFLNGYVLQLEGLVGDYDLLRAIETNTLVDYMSDFGVQYVTSYEEPPADYSQWTLFTPSPQLSSGPHAEIPLCKQTELQRFGTQHMTFHIWKWPSCGAE
jgi:hypothetical protein